MSSRPRIRPQLLRTPVLPGKGDSSQKTYAARNGAPVPLIGRIERALVLAAYVVVRHGPVYAPLVDRLERELEAARQKDPTERAKRILDAYAADGSQGEPAQQLLVVDASNPELEAGAGGTS